MPPPALESPPAPLAQTPPPAPASAAPASTPPDAQNTTSDAAPIPENAAPATPPTEEQEAQEILSTAETEIEGSSNFVPSYGTWTASLIYPSAETRHLRNILALYERKGYVVAKKQTKPELSQIYKKLEEEPIPENLFYPSFKLRFIAFRNAGEWTLRLNGWNITDKSGKPDDIVRVLRVSKESADFVWTPSDPQLLSAFMKKHLLPPAASSEHAEPHAPEEKSDAKQKETHRKAAAGTKQGRFNQEDTSVYFTLRPNQVFSSETFDIYEGTPTSLVASVKATDILPLTAPPPTTDAAAGEENDPNVASTITQTLEKSLLGTSPNAVSGSDSSVSTEAFQKTSPKGKIMRALGLNP
jgi:hypothetical protein